jgi:chaperonin GroEL
VRIVHDALSIPAAAIAENAGYDGALVVKKISSGTGAMGFDSTTGETGDMFKLGIVDPAKVTRSALQNAASVASMLLSTEALITDVPEKKGEGGDEEGHHHDEFGGGGDEDW